ncbi:MAG: cytochrome C [Desulfobacterales bacterium CG23_combo_of_CG06-09_8_20_14_all_51_8]|nr:MAG: cytochrome C [Desulfobacterales bacterium CG23_combo_of_CG06-09_8_20_14_all_51_8]
MSSTNLNKAVSPEAGPDATPQAHDSASSKSSGWAVFTFFMIGFVGSLLAGWILFPELLYSQKNQPIDFNHAVHLDAVTDGCDSCHYFREDGSFSGMPDLAACEDCHQEAMTDNPEEVKFVEEYVTPGIEVPWLNHSKQPDCVFFSHAAHVQGADMSCASCHGDIGTSEHTRVYEENRITGYSRDIWGQSISRLGKPGPGDPRPMKMNDCAECHEDETGHKGACFQCHK